MTYSNLNINTGPSYKRNLKSMKSARVVTFSVILVAVTVILTVSLVITFSPNSGGPPDYEGFLLRNVDVDNIRKYQKDLNRVKISGTSDTKYVSQYIRDEWLRQGLTSVNYLNFTVPISKPSEQDNKVMIRDSNGGILFTSKVRSEFEGTYINESEFNKIPKAYVVNSPSGIVEGNLVYINYGRSKDIEEIKKRNIEIKGNIVIARQAPNVFAGDVVRLAQKNGAKGVILYIDPSEGLIGPDVYPKGLTVLSSDFKFANLGYYEDLQNSVEEDKINIPVQPISYADAEHILRELGGPEAPPDFQGGLDFKYHLGPELADSKKVKMDIKNTITQETITCVMGVIKGILNPDRYVLVGGHHDAWGVGGFDSSTSVLLETSRLLITMQNNLDYRSRRSIMFVSWSGSEQGHIGSNEFIKYFSTIIKSGVTAYVNHHIVNDGIDPLTSYLESHSHPFLRKILEDVTKLVPNPSKDDQAPYVYDSWIRNNFDKKSQRPFHFGIDGNSDYYPFMVKMAIPSLDFKFTGPIKNPLIHTPHDTWMNNILDHELEYHKASVRILSMVVEKMSDKDQIQYEIEDFNLEIKKEFLQLKLNYSKTFQDIGVDISELEHNLQEYTEALENITIPFQSNKNNIEKYNDALMLSIKALVSSKGIPGQPYNKYFIQGPNYMDTYSSVSFPGVRYLMDLHYENMDIKDQLISHVLDMSNGFAEATFIINSVL